MLRKEMFPILCLTLVAMLCAGCGAGGAASPSTASVALGTLTTISVTPANTSIAANTHQQYTATGNYTNPVSSRDITGLVTWSSSNTSIATISNTTGSDGLAAALSSAGTTTISASYGGKTGSTRLTVTAATLTSIMVTPSNPSISDGTTQQFIATGTFSDGSTQNITATVTWSSGTPSTATISNTAGSKGLATAVNAGTSTISAVYAGQTGSTILTVTPATLLSIAVTPSNPSIAEGANQQFIATGTYSDSTTQNITTTVTWSSSNTNVATISNTAGSQGSAAGVGGGTTTIRATLGSVNGTTTLTVTGSGIANLMWDAPTQYTDGSTLNPAVDLQSYKLYYGTVSHTYTQVVTVVNPGTSTVSESIALASGTYFFVVTSVSQDGMESYYSNEVAKTVY